MNLPDVFWCEQDYRGQMDEAIWSLVKALNGTIASIENGTFYEAEEVQMSDSFTLHLESSHDPEDLKQRAIQDTFQSMMRIVLDLVDKLLAHKTIMEQGLEYPKGLRTHQLILAYLFQLLDTELKIQTHKIATKTSLKNPVKIQRLGSMPQMAENIIEGLLAIRRSLEHHKGLANSDIDFRWCRLVPALDGVPQELPFAAPADQVIDYLFIEESRTFQMGTQISLTISDIQNVALTITGYMVGELQKPILSDPNYPVRPIG